MTHIQLLNVFGNRSAHVHFFQPTDLRLGSGVLDAHQSKTILSGSTSIGHTYLGAMPCYPSCQKEPRVCGTVSVHVPVRKIAGDSLLLVFHGQNAHNLGRPTPGNLSHVCHVRHTPVGVSNHTETPTSHAWSLLFLFTRVLGVS